MGVYDSVLVPCPKCGEKAEFQSKGGLCILAIYEMGEVPYGVMDDVNRHSPHECEKCKTKFLVGIRGNVYAPMTEEEANEIAPKVTHRDQMAAMMRSAITGAVFDVSRRFGLWEDMKGASEGAIHEILRAIYGIKSEEFDQKYENYRLEIVRMAEERRKEQQKFLDELEKIKKERGVT